MYRGFKPSELTPALRMAFEARGIVEHGNALKPGHTVQCVECFQMADGSIVKADGRIVTEVAREALAIERAQRAYSDRRGEPQTLEQEFGCDPWDAENHGKHPASRPRPRVAYARKW